MLDLQKKFGEVLGKIRFIVSVFNLEKILKSIIYILITGTFVSILFIFKTWIFPYITSKAISFRIIVELMSLVYIILALKFPRYRPRKSWILYSLLIFSALAIITSALGINPRLSFIGDLERMWGINMWLHLILFFIVISNTIKTKKEWFVFFNISLLTASYIAIYGYLQRWGVPGIFQTGIVRIQSVLGNSAYVAGILLLSSILSFYLLVKTNGFWWKTLFIAHILIQLPAMFMAEIRGAQVAFFFILLMVSLAFILKTKNKYLKKSIIGFLLLIILIFGLAFKNKDANWVQNNSILHRLTTISLNGGTVRTRLISWSAGWRAFQERPFRGFGMENYYYAFDKYFQADYYNIAPTETWFDRAHNMLVENLVAHGIFGLLAYLLIFSSTLIYLYKVYRQDKEQNWLFSLLLGSIVIAYFIQNIFVFDSLGVTMFFFFILAYVNHQVTNELNKEYIYEKQISSLVNVSIISFSAIIVFYLVFGMNVTHAQIARQNYEVQKSFLQNQDLDQTYDKITALFIQNTYLNRDSITMLVDTLTKVVLQIKSQERARSAFRIINFLISRFEKPEGTNNYDAYLKLNLVRLYLLKARFLKEDSSSFNEVLKEAQKVINDSILLSPERLHNYYFSSKIKVSLGDYDGALQDLKEALNYNPRYADTYLYLSQMYKLMGDDDNQQKYLQQAYNLKPSLKTGNK